MSRENVEIVRSAFAAYERGDMDAVLRLVDEDIVITQPSNVFGIPAQQYGHRGFLEALAIWPEQWEDFRIEILRIAAAPAGKVIATVRNRGRGKQSGIEVDMEFTFVFAIRDGKVTEWQLFVQEDEALEAVGLSE